MHCTNFNTEAEDSSKGGDVLVSVATLVTEGRIPGGPPGKSKKFYEGPHCTLVKGTNLGHKCHGEDSLCLKFENDRETVLDLCQKEVPLCIEVLLACSCEEIDAKTDSLDSAYVLEQWHFDIQSKKTAVPIFFNLNQLVSAIRSQLYFSQITAWLMTRDETEAGGITENSFRSYLTAPGKTLATSIFHLSANKHEFPETDIGNGLTLKVCCYSLPRTSTIPDIKCKNCATKKVYDIMDLENCLTPRTAENGAHTKDNHSPQDTNDDTHKNCLFDDRMVTSCTLKGKHRCDDLEEEDNIKIDNNLNVKRLCQSKKNEPSTSSLKRNLKVYIEHSTPYSSDKCVPRNVRLDMLHTKNDLNKDKGQLLLDAIERSGRNSTNESARENESDPVNCDKRASDIFSIKQNSNFSIYKQCDSPIPHVGPKKMRDISNIDVAKCMNVKKKIVFDEEKEGGLVEIPSPSEKAKFRKNLGSAATMVFHARTGLPLTSSPAPVRKGKSSFDFDSSINSVSAIKSALFSNGFSTDDESESDGSIVSPCSPDILPTSHCQVSPIKFRRKGHAAGLLGSFEESVLNGRLEPVSTVHGFTAELGASGSFVPKHLVVPVTVFFYTLGDNDKVSSPYLSHINLGKKGYNVPKSGTVQVTLFNPLRTVVKMFVIMYDLSDMPPNSQTFIRQRTLYMPTKCKDANLEWGPKWLRYLIHLRFMSSKSGKIYLHSDIRMIIFRKCDMDTATAHGIDMSYELRSFTHAPSNPKFSPRK
nr:protein FAM214A [Leptinotarsa decemlineata]